KKRIPTWSLKPKFRPSLRLAIQKENRAGSPGLLSRRVGCGYISARRRLTSKGCDAFPSLGQVTPICTASRQPINLKGTRTNVGGWCRLRANFGFVCDWRSYLYVSEGYLFPRHSLRRYVIGGETE